MFLDKNFALYFPIFEQIKSSIISQVSKFSVSIEKTNKLSENQT